jgi:chromosome segregation ATPase
MGIFRPNGVSTGAFFNYDQKARGNASRFSVISEASFGKPVVRGVNALTLFHLPQNIWQWIMSLFNRHQQQIATLQNEFKRDKKKLKKQVFDLTTQNTQLQTRVNYLGPRSALAVRKMRRMQEELEQSKLGHGKSRARIEVEARRKGVNVEEKNFPVESIHNISPSSSPEKEAKGDKSIEKERRFNQAATEYHEKSAQLDVREKELGTREQAINERENKLETKEKSIDEREKLCRELAEEINRLKEAEVKGERAQEQVNQQIGIIQILERNNEGLKQGNPDAEAALNLIITDLRKDLTTATEKAKRVDTLQEELNKLSEMHEQTKANAEIAEKQGKLNFESLQRENKTLEETIASLQEEKTRLTTEMEKLDEDFKELEKIADDFENRNTALAKDKKALMEQLKSYENTEEKIDDVNEQLQMAAKQLSKLGSQSPTKNGNGNGKKSPDTSGEINVGQEKSNTPENISVEPKRKVQRKLFDKEPSQLEDTANKTALGGFKLPDVEVKSDLDLSGTPPANLTEQKHNALDKPGGTQDTLNMSQSLGQGVTFDTSTDSDSDSDSETGIDDREKINKSDDPNVQPNALGGSAEETAGSGYVGIESGSGDTNEEG